MTVQQLSLADTTHDTLNKTAVPAGLRVVIPAMNTSETIEFTLLHLKELGLRPDQIHVIINNTTDDSRLRAERTGYATVHEQQEIFDRHQDVVCRLEGWGVPRSRLRGKGAAMFAGVLALRDTDVTDEDPILFLDADIVLESLREVDPVRRLIQGWGQLRDARIVKLSGTERVDDIIHPSLAAHPIYRNIAALRWPLCGQVALSWGTLRALRLATHYCVEMAMLMGIMDAAEHNTGALGEVQTNAPLCDDYIRHPSDRDVRFQMLWQIQRFLMQCAGTELSSLTREAIRCMNGSAAAGYWSRSTASQEPNQYTDVPVDAVLPSLNELLSEMR